MDRVAAVAAFQDGKMLWGRRRDNNKWTNPGGHLDKGELPRAGAKRELFEESGIDLPEGNFKFMRSEIVRTPKGKTIEVFGFKVNVPSNVSTSMKDDPDQEVHRWHWLPLKDRRLPEHVVDNLHSPDNVLLRGLNIPDKPLNKEAAVAIRTLRVIRPLTDDVLRQYMRYDRSRIEKKSGERMKGGLGDNTKDSKFNQKALKRGIKVEKEHTSDRKLSKEIAKDHLAEHPNYYKHLAKAEKNMRKEAANPKGFFDVYNSIFR